MGTEEKRLTHNQGVVHNDYFVLLNVSLGELLQPKFKSRTIFSIVSKGKVGMNFAFGPSFPKVFQGNGG